MQDLSATFATLGEQLLTLFTDPGSNLNAALALYAVVALLVLIVLIVGVMFVMGASDEEHDAEDRSEAIVDAEAVESVTAGQDAADIATSPPARRPRSLAVTVLVLAACVAGVLLVAGYTTSSPGTCEGCHATNPHSKAEKGSDPHAGVACVSCHETGGAAGRYALGVPTRAAHIAGHVAGLATAASYGRTTRAACAACHRDDIAGTTTDPERGVRMSHAEPLAASATCSDCHRLRSGVLSARGVGMNPCLRCHDSKRAPSACGTCHDKRASTAARVRKVAPAVQVSDVRCGGCHDEKAECDSCHGLRMPHTKRFMAYEHARAGALDLWYGGGRTCGKCHTSTRNPCSSCHSSMLGSGHGPGNAVAHRTAASSACDSCHQANAYARGRDFCVDLCHSSGDTTVGER